MFQLASGTKMTHVPFRSTADEMNSMLGGHIDLAIDSMTTLWPQAQAGAVRAIAVTSAKRVPTAPDLPTIGETLNGFSVSGWQGLFAPAGTPRQVIDWVNVEARKAFEPAEVRQRFVSQGASLPLGTPDEFAAHTTAERVKWGEVIRRANIRLE